MQRLIKSTTPCSQASEPRNQQQGMHAQRSTTLAAGPGGMCVTHMCPEAVAGRRLAGPASHAVLLCQQVVLRLHAVLPCQQIVLLLHAVLLCQ